MCSQSDENGFHPFEGTKSLSEVAGHHYGKQKKMTLRSCVSPKGYFIYGIHRPRFVAENFREKAYPADLGELPDGTSHRNTANFPDGPVCEPSAGPVFEIPNAFPFRGTTYIGKEWADARSARPESISLPAPQPLSFTADIREDKEAARIVRALPRPLRLALAVSSTDPRELSCLAQMACTLLMDEKKGAPRGLAYERKADGKVKALISDKALFEAVANNACLPDAYKQAMVLRPGVQGESEIVGDYRRGSTHVFEYLRRNSYIPWGHYAANMANDSVRYDVRKLELSDMQGMRHLYYQRSYARLATLLGIFRNPGAALHTEIELESIRLEIIKAIQSRDTVEFTRTLWGWNYGFDYAPSGYRLHASHQQVHQQFALIPERVSLAMEDGTMPSYACGDLVADFVRAYRQESGRTFFDCYQEAIEKNQRMDDDDASERSLVVYEDRRVLVFVPKAQTSQWELQLMPKTPVGNIFEADTAARRSLDVAIFAAMRCLGALGARMVTTIEYSKPINDTDKDQRLLLSFLPKLPESPGAFSEAQLRWINGHYPEDFAVACRNHLPPLGKPCSS